MPTGRWLNLRAEPGDYCTRQLELQLARSGRTILLVTIGTFIAHLVDRILLLVISLLDKRNEQIASDSIVFVKMDT